MSDMIDRQQAVDAICQSWCGCNHADCKYTGTAFAEEYILCEGCDDADIILDLPSAQPEITDEQAIEHLQASGWMQNHDKQMYEMGLRVRLADDSDSYDALLPVTRPEQRWISISEGLPEPGTKVLVTLIDHRRRKVNANWNDEKRYSIRIDKVVKYTAECEPFWSKGNTPSVVAWMPLPEPYREEGDLNAID